MNLPTAEAVTLRSTTPLWVALASLVLLQRWPSGETLLNLVCGIAGLCLILKPTGDGVSNLGGVAALASGVCHGVAIYQLPRLRGVSTPAVVAHYSTVSFLGALLILATVPAPNYAQGLNLPGTSLSLGAAILAVLSTAALLRANEFGSAALVSSLSYSTIVFALILDAALFAAYPDPSSFVGTLLVVAPLLLLVRRKEGRIATECARWPVEKPMSLTAPAAERLGLAIERAEGLTSCEFQVSVSKSEAGFGSKEAREAFGKLGHGKTTGRNALLFLVAPNIGELWLIGDEAIPELVGRRHLQRLVSETATACSELGLEAGLRQGLERAGQVLEKHFPPGEAPRNELSNEVIFEQ